MKVAIAGANGFVGSTILQELVKSGHEVELIKREHIADLTSPVPESLATFDCLINCAGSTDVSTETGIKTNINLPADLYEKFRHSGFKSYIHVSSVSAIKSSTQPGQVIHSDSLEEPDTFYGKTKKAGDDLLKSVSQGDNINICILRPPILYGNKASGIFSLLRKLALLGIPLPFSALNNPRNFMFIENFAQAVLVALKQHLSGTYINVDHDPISPKSLYNLMTMCVGKGNRTFDMGRATFPLLRLALQSRSASLIDESRFSDDLFRRITNYSPRYSRSEAMLMTMKKNSYEEITSHD